MHISVLAAAVSMLIGRFTGRSRSFFITLALLLVYGCLIGFSASLTRAILIFAAYRGAAVLGRYSDSVTRLGGAMLFYLLLKPTDILDAGFVLSFSASAGISLLYEPITHLLHADRLLHSRMGHGIMGALHSTLVWIVRMLISTLAAQLAVLPAVIHYFGAQPLFSVIVNLLAVPLAMTAYIASFIGALSCLKPVAAIGDMLFGLLTRLVAFFGDLPASTLRIARFPLWLVLICTAACLLSSGLTRLPIRIRRFLPLTVLAAVLVSNACAALTTLGCSIVYLDAGHADCAVLRTQGKVYLFDTGDSYSPAADYLSAMNYSIEAVFLSHMHIDHAGGLADILEYRPPKRIYISANWDSYEADEGVAAILEKAGELGCELIPLSAGDSVQLSSETSLQVYAPAAGVLQSPANEDSLVLHIEYRGSSALFTGDAPAKNLSGKLTDVDILKAAHHGAADSLNPDLLLETTPSAVIIPTGYNTYGHPANETLSLLERAETAVFRTDECGAITCSLGRDGDISISTYLNPEITEAAHGLE